MKTTRAQQQRNERAARSVALFLARQQTATSAPAPATSSATLADLARAFRSCDTGDNYVSLVALRSALAIPRTEADRLIEQARRSGYYLEMAERQVSQQEYDAGIRDEQLGHLYVVI